MSASPRPRVRSVLGVSLVSLAVILGLYVVFFVAVSLDPGWDALLVVLALNSAVIYVARRLGTPRGRLINMVCVGALVTVVQPVAICGFWAYSENGNGWFVPLVVAGVITVVLAALRSTRGYAVALVVGNLNAVFGALVLLASVIPPS